jgi:hypothetical protein
MALLLCGAAIGGIASSFAQSAPAAAPAASAPAQPVAGGVAGVAGGKAAPGAAAPDAAVKESTDPLQDSMLNVGIEESFSRKTALRKPAVTPEQVKSLFYTVWQHALLQEAKRGFLSRPPTAGELTSKKDASKPTVKGIREISLGGIAYIAPKQWTIWLNDQRVQPDAIPKQIIDIKVSDDHVDLKWFDEYTNLIYPIRIRPHQRFNLDTRIFLPGVPVAGPDTVAGPT